MPPRLAALFDAHLDTKPLLEQTFSSYYYYEGTSESDKEQKRVPEDQLPVHIFALPMSRIRVQHVCDLVFALLAGEQLKYAQQKQAVTASLVEAHAILAVFQTSDQKQDFITKAGQSRLNFECIVIDEIAYEGSAEFLYGKRDHSVRIVTTLLLRHGVRLGCKRIYKDIQLAESSAINKGVYKANQHSSLNHMEEEEMMTVDYFTQGVEVYMSMWEDYDTTSNKSKTSKTSQKNSAEAEDDEEEEKCRFTLEKCNRIHLQKADPLLFALLQGFFVRYW